MPPYRKPDESDADYYARYAELSRIFLERRHKVWRVQCGIMIVTLVTVIGIAVAAIFH